MSPPCVEATVRDTRRFRFETGCAHSVAMRAIGDSTDQVLASPTNAGWMQQVRAPRGPAPALRPI